MKSPDFCFDCLSYFKRRAPSVLEGPSSNSLIRLDNFQRGRELIFVSISVDGNKGKAVFFQKTGICQQILARGLLAAHRKIWVFAFVYICVEQLGMPASPRSSSPQPPGEGTRDGLSPTRESLLSRLKDWEDRESWQDFFDTYWKWIYSMARKASLSDAEAQDIVQETVVSVARKIEGFKYDPAVCSFKTWMLQLTRWRIINQLKKRQREEDQREHFPEHGDATPTVEQIPDPAGFDLESIWDEEWEKNLLAAALERVKRLVDPEQFQIFDLYCLEQWAPHKVASTLGVVMGRVYLAKHRIGRLLKKEIKKLECGR